MTNNIDATEYSSKSLRADVAQAGLAKVSRSKAIRAKCLDCVGGSAAEVSRCHIKACALWPFRFGTDPWSGRTGNPNAVAALAEYRTRRAAE